MTPDQINFLANLTDAQAQAVILKFKSDPEIAARKSDEAYRAFCVSWERLNPGEYWQRVNRARADGGTQYRLVYDSDQNF